MSRVGLYGSTARSILGVISTETTLQTGPTGTHQEKETQKQAEDSHRKSIGRGEVDGMVIHAIINITKGEN